MKETLARPHLQSISADNDILGDTAGETFSYLWQKKQQKTIEQQLRQEYL